MPKSNILTPEQDLAIRLARVDDDDANDAETRRLLEKPLDWNWIIVTATRHKTVQLLWHNMARKDLIAPAMGTGGLPELWTVYLSQLYTAGAERNRRWMDNAQKVSGQLLDAGVRIVIIKGGALIGDVYTVENRFLNDIDFLARREDIEAVRNAMFEFGYEYGSYNYASGCIDPIDRRVERAWLFNNHVMPNFYRLTGNPVVPYYKIQIGFDFFDPFEDFSVDGPAVVKSAAAKPGAAGLLVPAQIDTLMNLCCHIYREGVSLVYDDYNVNWQLGKFCDLLSFLLKHDAELGTVDFMRSVDAQGIRKPMFYAFHFTHEVYRHPVLQRWLEATDPSEREYLNELRDGSRRIAVEGPFQERLFSLRNVRSEFRAGWNKQFRRNQW